jgi:hypothetical protein
MEIRAMSARNLAVVKLVGGVGGLYCHGYAIVELNDDGDIKINSGGPWRNDPRAFAGAPQWLRKEWEQLWVQGCGPFAERINPSLIDHIVGPVDSPAVARIRANWYTQNWSDRGFVARAGDVELHTAMSQPSEPEIYAAMCALRLRYAS